MAAGLCKAVVLNLVPGGLNQTHLIQIISSLAETRGLLPEIPKYFGTRGFGSGFRLMFNG